MTNPTTPFSWQMPTAADLVTDLPADFEVFGQAVATSMADLLGGTTGQILAKNSSTDMDFVWVTNDVGDITAVTATTPLTGGGTSGAITVGIQDATTSVKGAVQLSDSTSTTSSILAATPTAVKAAYDLAVIGSTTNNNLTMVQQYTATESVLKNIPSRIPAAEQLLKQAVYWIDAAQSDNSDQVLDNQGWGAPALTTQLGSSASADSNDPKFLDFAGTNYAYLPGVAGNFLSVPDASTLDITGDLDLRVYMSLDSYNFTSTLTLLSKDNLTAGTRSYSLDIVNTGSGNGALQLTWTTDGSTGTRVVKQSTVNVNTVGVAGVPIWLRGTLDVDNGAVGNDVKFFTSSDGSTWTQLGTTVTTIGTTSVYAGTSDVQIGAVANLQHITGNLYNAQILNGIAGTKVLDVNTSIIGSGSATTFNALTGQTVTINRSTSGKKIAVVTHPVWLFGTDDYMEVADNAFLDFAATDSFTLFAVQRQWNTFGTNDAILGKKADTTAATAGYLLGDDGTTAALARMQSGDGTIGTSAVTGSSRTAGTLNTIAGVRNVSSDNTIVYLNGVAGTAVTDTTTATLANAEVMRLGRLSGAGTEYNDMELVAAAIFRRVLTADEITTLYNYYTARVGA
jgi:hypothetical protein